jgi:hypothetical protein
MSLNDLVNVNIVVEATAPSAANFGVPLIAAYHTHNTDLIRYYSDLAGMVSDGFSETEPSYLCAEAVMSQNPTVASFAIGRRALPYTQTLKLTLSSASASDTYSFNLTGSNGVVNAVSVASSGVPATDAASVSSAIGLLSNVGTPSHSGTSVTIVQASGKMNNIDTWASLGAAGQPILALTDATADPGIATDLGAIYGVDQGWYGIALDSNSAAEIEGAAHWVEANGAHVMCVNNSDAADIGSGASVFTVLKASSYARTFCQFNGSELLCYSGAATLGVILPLTPGSYTPAYKTLVGSPADPSKILTGTAITNLNNAGGNYYTTYKSVNVLISGLTPSGEYLDTTVFIDWLKDAIQTAVFTLLTNNLKIAYTDLGVAQVVNVIKGVLGQGVQNQGLAATPAPTVSAPTVASISMANVAKRNVPNITFTATLAGAIQSLQISGSVVLP